MADSTHARRAARGCGCVGLLVMTLAVVLAISVVAWVLSFLGQPIPRQTRTPVPDTIPPAAAEAPPLINVHAPGRTSDQLAEWAAPIAEQTGVDAQAVRAYGNAALIAAEAWPACHLNWNTLAGIGWVETRHGTYTGHTFDSARLGEDGVAVPSIIGPQLDGSESFAVVHDTDGGEFDGDTTFDRALGPMQFIPESWQRYGRDANGDGYPDPQQIDDAALGTANLLCANGRDLDTEDGWYDAVHAYNQSNEYVRKVRNAAANYALNQSAPR
ncbi:lytic transglycosylase domain-containing protein [Corynebacterium hadale]|uniref:lytic transglycosylase domain-containing protein n=1 Tax=Corynebacterium hadale TaxID=2026255 RepID=UPI001F0AC015|nr:lytic murein transglycosylase [Corynebacterium hadale]